MSGLSRLPRLFIDPERLHPALPLRLRGAEHHYLSHVLRMGLGSQVLLLDGNGRQVLASVAGVSPDELELDLLSIDETGLHGGPRVTLFLGLLKGDRHDFAIQKATELGVHRIVSISCRRSVPSLGSERAERRQVRWQRVVQSAAQQCRRLDLPEVTAPLTFAEALRTAPAGLRLMLYEGPAPPLRSVLPPADAAPVGVEIALLVGPEGGFEDGEVAEATEAGFQLCSLGPRVLRAETAALAGLAVLLTG